MYDEITGCSFTAQNFRREELERFADVLRAMGVNIDCEITRSGKTARVTVSDLPSIRDARVSRTRNAGRHGNYINPPIDSIFNSGTTCRDFLAWLDGKVDGQKHTAAEAMKELGLSRSTYFRKVAKMRELTEWERVHNPERVKDGMKELHHTLGNVN